MKKYIIIILILPFLSSCKPDQKEWGKIKATNETEILESFINKFPESQYVDSAINNIWVLTRKADATESYKHFIALFPKNAFVDSAQVQIEIIQFQEVINSNKKEDYYGFIEKYPNSLFKDSVNHLIRNIELEEKFNDLLSSNNYNEIRKFIEEYPDASVLEKYKLKSPIVLNSQPKSANKGYKLTLKKLNRNEFSYILTLPPNTDLNLDFDANISIEKGNLTMAVRNGKIVPDYKSSEEGVTISISVSNKKYILLSSEYIEIKPLLLVHLGNKEKIISGQDGILLKRTTSNNNFTIEKGEACYFKF